MATKKQTLCITLLNKIQTEEIADFLVKETQSLFDCLNLYKLNNIMKNIEMFHDFIVELDQQNTLLYKKICKQKKQSIIEKSKGKSQIKTKKTGTAPHTYISTKGWKQLTKQEKNFFSLIPQYEKNKIATIIRGLYILSISDFSQGSLCRLENKYYHRIERSFLRQKTRQTQSK